MENKQKPEWFELADNDQPVNRPLKNAPRRNLALILAGVLVLPMGAGFALLSHDEHSAVAAETLNLTQASPTASTTKALATASPTKAPTAIASPSSLAANDLILPPTKKADDDDEEDDD